jgi:hypothetical protein
MVAAVLIVGIHLYANFFRSITVIYYVNYTITFNF